MPDCAKNSVCIDEEWGFVIKETHSTKPSPENRLDREMLLALQVLLAKKSIALYLKTKRLYLVKSF
ncbi:MAG: hypothetical protein LBI57_01345 [Helicobacteraceae bacterium]|jgi:hypothetical protein|nr:hypothetical protein [Helicobacteraceae bacterium]